MADTTIVGGLPGGRPTASATAQATPQAAPQATTPSTFPSTARTAFPAGTPVAQSLIVEKTSISAQTTSAASATVTGLVAADVAEGAEARVQTDGTLTLSPAQWAKVGAAGGLTPGTVYYLSEDKPGISSHRPQRTGSWSVKIGVALSTVTLLLRIGEPVQV